jgi:hypothetical integral membrane protein (TIGR02206 family)
LNWLWRETPFVLFGPAHLAALALCGVSAVGLACLGRRSRGLRRQLGTSRVLAALILLTQVPLQLESALPRNWDLRYSLPLHVCDVAWMIAVYALWTHRSWAFGLVYYWGLTMTFLAMLTPELRMGFPHFYFLMFYSAHGVVVVSAAYLAWGVGLRPTWRLYRMTLAVTAAYSAVLHLFNRLAGTNYMFLNGKPDNPTLLDYMGPYPVYLLIAVALAFLVWAAMTWPWCRSTPPGSVEGPDPGTANK